MSRRRVALALALVLASVAGATVVAVGQSGNQTDGGATATDYSLSELQRGGEVVDERFPSLRAPGEFTAFWLVHYPPNGMGSYASSSQRQFVEPSSTVNRRKVRLKASFPFDGENRSFTMTKVYWRPDTRTIRGQNGTSTSEQYANISAVDTQELTYQSGMRRSQDVRLRGYYDRSTHVTLFLDIGEEQLRWTFQLKTIQTAAPVNIQDRGDLWMYVLTWVFLPSLVAIYISDRKVTSFRRRARAGTGHSPSFWIGLMSIAAIAAYVFGYYALTSLIAHLPVLVPLYLAGVVAAFRLEDDEDAVERWAFIRVDPETRPSPLDADGQVLDAGEMDIQGFDVIEDGDGQPVLYNPGILAMWARAKGCFCRLDIRNAEEADWTANGDYDRVFVVDADADQLVETMPERVIWAWPWRTYQPPTDKNGDPDADRLDPGLFRVLPRELGVEDYFMSLGFVAVPLLTAFASQQFIGAWQWGVLACAPLVLRFAEPIEGAARTELAPGMAGRQAWVTSFYMDLNLKRFGSVEKAVSALYAEANRSHDLSQFLDEERDESLVTEAHDSDSSPFSTSLADVDPVVAEDSTGDDGDDPSNGALSRPMEGGD